MDFDGGGGIAGGLGYGNGYTPLANAAIANNNANYWGNQNYAANVGQYDPFAASGGFGNQTANYAALGAAYGRAIPGGNAFAQTGYPAGDVQRGPDLPDLSAPTLPGADPYQQWLNAGGYNAPENWQPGGVRDAIAAALMQQQQATQPAATFDVIPPKGAPNALQTTPSADPLEWYNKLMNQRYDIATETSRANDPTTQNLNINPMQSGPGWGVNIPNFPIGRYDLLPQQPDLLGWGSSQYPLVGVDRGDQGSKLLDPNMLNPFRDTWTNAS
jgi:hypothetical protein